MTIKVVPHEQAVKMQQRNRQLEQSLSLTPMPTLINDMMRNQLFHSPRLQMTNWAWEIKKQMEAEEERKKQQQRIAYRQQHQADDGFELG